VAQLQGPERPSQEEKVRPWSGVVQLQGPEWPSQEEKFAHGVEWFNSRDPSGQVGKRKFPLPRSLANVKRGFSEKKWAEPKGWAKKRLDKTVPPQ